MFRYLVGPITIVLISAAAGCSGPSSGSDPGKTVQTQAATSDRGSEIVAEFQKRDAAPYRKDRVRFTVKDEDGKTEVSEIDVWRSQSGDTTTTLSVIAKPLEDAGTGSLSIQEKGKQAVNVTYASSRDEFRETGTAKMFFGGLTIQELLGEWDKYDFRVTGERELAGKKVVEVEGKLKPEQKSLITTSKMLFDAETYLPVEMHLFDASGKEIRTYSKAEVRTMGGRAYIAKIEVTNSVYNSQTTIEIVSREYPERLDDSMFTREKLKSLAKK